MTTDEILNGLNEEQLQAATSIDGAVRLIAGAGSGKTFTLTRRVAYIAAVKGIDPSRILSLTFTNKAAGEMRERVAKVLGVSEDVLNMKTFHSLAVDIVKRDCNTVFGWKSFSIGQSSAHVLVPSFFRKHPELLNGLSDAEQREIKTYIMGKVYNAINSDYYVEWLDKKSGRIPLATLEEVKDYMTKDATAKLANDAYKRAVKDGNSAKIKEKAEYYNSVALPHEKGKVTPVGTWVHQIVQDGKNGICSFDDLVKCAKYMLENYPEIKNYWSNLFDYIQVDEFQDTDSTQLAIVQALYERHGNLFVVGDPDQSIYLFRGAEPTLFNNLGNYIPNLQTIFMETNYRSTDEIVKISNSVIELNRNRIPKTCESKAGQGNKIKTLFGNSDISLATVETVEIKKLINDGISPNDIAILYRNSNDNTVVDIQDALKKAGIPIVTTLVKESKYPKFVLGLCKFNRTQDNTYLIESAETLDDSNGLNPPTVFVDINELGALDLNSKDLIAFLDKVLYAVGKRDGKPLKSYQRFLDDKDQIVKDIDNTLDYWNKLSDLEQSVLCNPLDLRDDENDMVGDGVHIITMHKSKGLEYPYVFVNGLTKAIMDNKMDNNAACEEQARLIYVAYSRAKVQLYLCCDNVDDMHGTMGKVLGASYVEKPKELPDNIVKQSIKDYLDRLDAKAKIGYTPLQYESVIKGYRCTYSINGEKIAYQASIEDLERLDCVPQEQRQIVKVDAPIPIAKIQGKDLICNDELDKAIKRITLENDDDIITVFCGSNKLYTVDNKDRNKMCGLKEKYIKKATPVKAAPSVQPQSAPKVATPMPVVQKNSKTKADIDYNTFVGLNGYKKGHKARIIDIQGSKVQLLEVNDKKTILIDMLELVDYVKKGVMHLTNPSLLQNYGIWKGI